MSAQSGPHVVSEELPYLTQLVVARLGRHVTFRVHVLFGFIDLCSVTILSLIPTLIDFREVTNSLRLFKCVSELLEVYPRR